MEIDGGGSSEERRGLKATPRAPNQLVRRPENPLGIHPQIVLVLTNLCSVCVGLRYRVVDKGNLAVSLPDCGTALLSSPQTEEATLGYFSRGNYEKTMMCLCSGYSTAAS